LNVQNKKKLENTIEDTINSSYANFSNILNSSINKYFSNKYVRFNKYKQQKTEWVTNGIFRSIRYSGMHYQTMKSTLCNDLNYAISKINLTTNNKIPKECIRQGS